MKNRVLPMIASIGIGAAAYSLMTGRGGQLQNMIPQLASSFKGNKQSNTNLP